MLLFYINYFLSSGNKKFNGLLKLYSNNLLRLFNIWGVFWKKIMRKLIIRMISITNLTPQKILY